MNNIPTRDCNACPYWRRAGSKIKGVRLPDGRGGYASGKCTHPQGPDKCRPKRLRGVIGGERAGH